MKPYYVQNRAKEEPDGPYMVEELKRLRREGKITDNDQVARDGDTAWRTVGEVLGSASQGLTMKRAMFVAVGLSACITAAAWVIATSHTRPHQETSTNSAAAGELARLAASTTPWIREGVAENPGTPELILMRLASDSDITVRKNVAENQNASKETLNRLAVDPEESVSHAAKQNLNTKENGQTAYTPTNPLEQLAQDPTTDAATLTRLASNSNEWVRGLVACNPNTPVSTLNRLAGDADKNVRWFVSSSAVAPVAILARLAEDSDSRVRWGVAVNPRTPPDILLKLVKDREELVRTRVIANPGVTPQVLAVFDR